MVSDTPLRKKTLDLVRELTPCSNVRAYSDVWEVTGLATKWWTIVIPPDNMVYHVIDYSEACYPDAYVAGALYINSTKVFEYFEGYSVHNVFSTENPIVVRYPDVLYVYVWNGYASYRQHYWCVSVYRKPA